MGTLGKVISFLYIENTNIRCVYGGGGGGCI